MTPIDDVLIANKLFPEDLPINPLYGWPTTRETGATSLIKVEAQGNAPGFNPRTFEIEFFGTPLTCQFLTYEMAQTKGSAAPLYVYDNKNGWMKPSKVTAEISNGCTYASFMFQLQ
jgi:hypothetical protein